MQYAELQLSWLTLITGVVDLNLISEKFTNLSMQPPCLGLHHH